LWRLIEPGTPPPASRLRVLARLAAAGVPCGVNMAPILPGLTDTDAAIVAVAAARDHRATSFWAAPLRLAPLVKEHYFEIVARQFPELLCRYQCSYPGADAPAAYREQLRARIAAIKTHYDFGDSASRDLEVKVEPRQPARQRPDERQLALPL